MNDIGIVTEDDDDDDVVSCLGPLMKMLSSFSLEDDGEKVKEEDGSSD